MIVNRELAISGGVDQKDLWATPGHIFDKLDKEFGFTLDPCCVPETAKCVTYFTPNQDGLAQSWKGHTVFCNPPYSKGNIDKWVKKCSDESQDFHTCVVALLPVSTSSKWWHEYIVGKCQMRFIERRVRFVGAKDTAPFSSVIVVFGGSGTRSFKQTP